ncbi:hypothetical protein [Belnapia rosea]|uniref:hypothetical protein n=1 Tax=Belnapia rosea TaxID=938405 RepID=UPI0008918F0B|nr:hypothetical protein [Belnapia rosea]SDB68835.1 hypothetical protein SAMN02927895_03300 [Belnapia rosea]
MDGGYQALELARGTDRLATPAGGPSGWAGRLTAWAGQAEPTGTEAAGLSTAAGEPGWAAKLKAHVRQAGGLRSATLLFRPSEPNPVSAFLESLTLLREQLLRERQRADAAEAFGPAQVAVAEAALREAQARLTQREGELAALEDRLAEAVKRAERAEKEAQSAQQGLRRLRSRGLFARILNIE